MASVFEQFEEGHELRLTTIIDAPPPVVWSVITERLAEWWCPKPWWTEVIELDWRSGGRMATIMHGPEGETSGGDGLFLHVEPGRRFAFTDAVDSQMMPQGPFMIGMFELFADGAAGTRLVSCARHWTREAMEEHKTMGFEAGWSAVAAQLKALCEAG